MLRIVLDTNVYVSGLINQKSNIYDIIKAFFENKIILLISHSIRDEILNVLLRPKIQSKYNISSSDVDDLMTHLSVDALNTKYEIKIDAIQTDSSDKNFLLVL